MLWKNLRYTRLWLPVVVLTAGSIATVGCGLAESNVDAMGVRDANGPDAGEADAAGLETGGAVDAPAEHPDDVDAPAEPSDSGAGDAEPWSPPVIGCKNAEADGGGSAVTPPPTMVAGSRIRPRYLVLDDGTQVLEGLYDSALETICRLEQRDEVGKSVCVPAQVAWRLSHSEGNVERDGPLFRDDTCLVPVLGARPSCPPPRIGTVDGQLVRVGPPVSRSVHVRNAAGVCFPLTGPLSDGNGDLDFFAAGEAVVLPQVVFREERVRMTETLDAVVQVGDDGSRVWFGNVYDAEHDLPTRSRYQVGVLRLIPNSGATYHGDCCRISLDDVGPCYRLRPPRCEGEPLMRAGTTLALLGDQVRAQGPPVTTLGCSTGETVADGGPCRYAPETVTGYHRMGAPVPDECFPEVQLVTSGTGSVRFQGLATGGVVLPWQLSEDPVGQRSDLWNPLYNAEGKRCQVVAMSDGSSRCVPGAISTGYFWDPVCTELVGSSGGDVAIVIDREPLTTACPERIVARAFDFDGPQSSGSEPASYYRRTYDGACELAPGSFTRGRRLGAERPPTDFPEVTPLSP